MLIKSQNLLILYQMKLVFQIEILSILMLKKSYLYSYILFLFCYYFSSPYLVTNFEFKCGFDC